MAQLLGLVRVPLSRLHFPDGRQLKHKTKKKLEQVYERTGFQPHHRQNQIEVKVNASELDVILQELALSQDGLRATLLGEAAPPELLVSGPPLRCSDGKHRVAAARAAGKSDASWTVVLARDDGIPHGPRHAHQTVWPDGEIFYNVRSCQRLGDESTELKWRECLTEPKKKSLNMVLSRTGHLGGPNIVELLDAIVAYPGLRDSFHLGSWHKHLVLHIDEFLARGLETVGETYTLITFGVADGSRFVQLDDVEFLQLRAPSRCPADRQAIEAAMDDGSLFRQCTDPQSRERLKQNILSISSIIPSMKTFHENMKYISIGAKILRRYLPKVPDDWWKSQPKQPRMPKGRRRSRPQPTLLTRLRWLWNEPALLEIESKDGEFVPYEGKPTIILVCIQMWLAALRDFARLSTDPPRQDRRSILAFVHRDREKAFLVLSRRLGLNLEWKYYGTTPAIEPSDSAVPANPDDDEPNSLPEWRCGRPFTRTFHHLQGSGFIPQMAADQDSGLGVSPEFVLSNILLMFFGRIHLQQRSSLQNSGPGETPSVLVQDNEPQSEYELDDLPDAPQDTDTSHIKYYRLSVPADKDPRQKKKRSSRASYVPGSTRPAGTAQSLTENNVNKFVIVNANNKVSKVGKVGKVSKVAEQLIESGLASGTSAQQPLMSSENSAAVPPSSTPHPVSTPPVPEVQAPPPPSMDLESIFVPSSPDPMPTPAAPNMPSTTQDMTPESNVDPALQASQQFVLPPLPALPEELPLPPSPPPPPQQQKRPRRRAEGLNAAAIRKRREKAAQLSPPNIQVSEGSTAAKAPENTTKRNLPVPAEENNDPGGVSSLSEVPLAQPGQSTKGSPEQSVGSALIRQPKEIQPPLKKRRVDLGIKHPQTAEEFHFSDDSEDDAVAPAIPSSQAVIAEVSEEEERWLID